MKLDKGDAKIRVHGRKKANAKKVFKKWIGLESKYGNEDVLVVKFAYPLTVHNVSLSHQYTANIKVSANADTLVTQVSM